MICLSVIIPVYNTEAFLPRAINSVLQSSLTSIEIIVVDDGSLGGCEELVQNLYKNDPRIVYVKHETNKGLLSARYTGIIHAQGEFLAHLDPDDWIVNDIFAKAYTFASEDKLDVVIFGFKQCNEVGKEWIEAFNCLPDRKHYRGENVLDSIFRSRPRAWVWHLGCNKLIRTTVAKESMVFVQEERHIVMYEDLLRSVALFAKLFDSNTIGTLHEEGLMYFRHSESITQKSHFRTYQKKYQDADYILSKIATLLTVFELFPKYNKHFQYLRCNIFERYSPWKNRLDGKIDWMWLWIHRICYWVKTYRCCQFNDMQDAAHEIMSQVKKSGTKKVAIFGTGEFGIYIFKRLQKEHIDIVYFISSDKQLVGKTMLGIPIVSPLESMHDNEVDTICIASQGSIDTIKTLLERDSNKKHPKRFMTSSSSLRK